MKLVLVRHGESVVTVNRVIGGMKSCEGLSPLGHQQADALRDRLARTGELGEVDLLVASTLPRAIQTAERLAEALPGVPVVHEADWCEHDPGTCDGMTFTDFVEQYGRPNWEDPWAEQFPGGESLAEFHERVRRALSRLIREHRDETVVIACHGGVIDAALRALMHLPMVGGFELHTKNTSLTELQRVGIRWRLLRYNDAAHLEGLPLETQRAAEED